MLEETSRARTCMEEEETGPVTLNPLVKIVADKTPCHCSDQFARQAVYSPSSKPAVEYTGLADIGAAPGE